MVIVVGGGGGGNGSGFFDLGLLPKTLLKMFNRNPFFSSFIVMTLVSLLTVVTDPRETGFGVSIISFSIVAVGVEGDAGTMESKLIP
jgi:hypothetical protein